MIRTLVDMTAERFSHYVYSLNRRTPSISGFVRASVTLREMVRATSFSHGQALTYLAPPKGLFHQSMLKRLARWIGEDIAAREARPDLIVGHKLTIEGIVAEQVANALGIPFAISIQGDSDTKILSARRDLSRSFGRIFHDAKMVFPFAPWALSAVEKRLGMRKGATVLLPCPTDIDHPTPPQIGNGSLVSVFHLKNARRKNLDSMAAASTYLADRDRQVPISIVGGGSDSDRATCQRLIGNAPGVTLAGPMNREALREFLPTASGFIMPSRRESFGLVFIEALFCGLPIIYPKGQAIDGFLDNAPFALAVDAQDPASIANAMQHVIDHEAELKSALADWQASDGAARFKRTSIAEAFAGGLNQAIT
ncbi:MAG: glycosyltransferase [Novosphingobium sp.]